jgi:activator of HSP90 ATPase
MDLFPCFVDANRVKAYAGGDAQINPTKGGKFSMFGGAVSGEFVDIGNYYFGCYGNQIIEAPTKIVQKWRFSSWPEGLWSTVTMAFEEKSGKTVLTITHKGIPESDQQRTESGWSENFCRRIRGVFGFGGIN